MIKKVDHIGIAVKNLSEVTNFYENILGLKPTGTEIVSGRRVRVTFLPVGDTEIELVESTDEEGPIAKFIEKNGEGIQHIAFQVDDLEATIAKMKEKGIKMLDEKPLNGAGGKKIAFSSPESMFGVTMEFCQKN